LTEPTTSASGPIHFSVFQVNLHTGEIRKNGSKIKLEGQPFQILALLLEQPGELVTREELEQKLWAPGTFVDFEHSINTAVKRLREVLGDSADSPHFIETLPRRGYRFIYPVDCRPVPTEVSRPTGWWRSRWVFAPLGIVALLGILLAVNFGGLRHGLLPASVAPRIESLAVLPVANLTGDPAQEYFADGMTEELITEFSKVHAFKRVIPRTSAMAYKGAKKPLREIARELGVDAVLEASLLQTRGQVRITVRLIDGTTEQNLWADRYERNLSEVPTLYTRVVGAVARQLGLTLTSAEQARLASVRPVNPEAYDAYLRGRALDANFDNPEKLGIARTQFERALQADPEYPLGLAGLADVEARYCRNVELSEACLQRAEALAVHALARDPNLALPHVALGHVYGTRYDYAHAERELRKAVELDPNDPSAWMLLAWALSYKQPPEALEAEAAAREAIRLSYSMASSYYQLGRALMLQGRYGEAIAAFDQALRLDADFASPHVGLAQTYLAQGNYKQALAELDKWGDSRKTPHVVFQRSLIFAAQGEKEKALEKLEQALSGGYRDFAQIDASPYLSSLRSDLRFQQLIRRYRK
jgi:TolB-like protein/DNA-binding winged helix-turn-helix (wHTH) protein/tetratricopeptide (TPR) repeat protein